MGFALALEPSVAKGTVVIRLSASAISNPTLRVIECGGRLVARINVPKPEQPIVWRPLDRNGTRLAAGTYFVVLQVNGQRLVRKLVLK